MTERILIIEDEIKIARLIEMELGYEGYRVECAYTGREGLEKAFDGGWDAILLDIMLPELNGLEVLRRIRQADVLTPVILLTARGTTPDKVSGLDLGANDYITKPFEIEEVLARIRSCIRIRNLNKSDNTEDAPLICLEDLSINQSNREVIRDGTKIDLTPKEFDLLLYLIENRNRVLSRDQIIQKVWGYDYVGETNIVDVYIRYIRRKVDYPFQNQLIYTYRGVGYCMKESDK